MSEFRDHCTQNFEDVCLYSERNQDKLKDIENFYRKRAALESRYAADLNKLCTASRGVFETSTTSSHHNTPPLNKVPESLENFWPTLCEGLSRTAECHESFARSVSTSNFSVANTIHQCSETYSSCRKSLIDQGRLKKKELEDIYTNLKKAKLQYDNYRKEAKELKLQLSNAENNYQLAGKVQKLKQKVEAARAKRKQAKFIFIEGEQNSKVAQNEFYCDQIPELLDKFQMLEQWRCQWIKDSILESNVQQMKLIDNAGKKTFELADCIDMINVESDLTSFATFYGEQESTETKVSAMSLLNPTMSGRLEHTQKVLGTPKWKQYFFVYMSEDRRLYMYESEDSKHYKAIFYLTNTVRSVRPCDKSLTGKDHVFQLKQDNSSDAIFLCAPTEEVYYQWYQLLERGIAIPPSEKAEEGESVQSLRVKILEAKNLPIGNYFILCCLDSELQARTQVKANTATPFWSEEFEFNTLPGDFQNLAIYIMSSEKKSVTHKIFEERCGLVTISKGKMAEVVSSEKWMPVKSLSLIQTESPSIRMEYTFSNEKILPLKHYFSLADALWNNDVLACLNTVIIPANREKTARALLNIYRTWGRGCDFLNDLSFLEIQATDNANIIFRSNSLASKALDQWMKIVGMDFLHRALGSFCEEVYTMRSSCEVDPTRLTNANEARPNFKRLLETTEKAWQSILHAMKGRPPYEMRFVFQNLQRCAIDKFEDDEVARYTTISGLFFLRFICPAILNPKLFNIMPTHPSPSTARTLTLIAKTLQNLANLVEFGAKEPYMVDMNDFIKNNKDSFKSVITDLCTVYPGDEPEIPPIIDLSREMAKTHNSVRDLRDDIEAYSIDNPSEGISELLFCLSDLELPLEQRRLHQTGRLPDISLQFQSLSEFNQSSSSIALNSHSFSEIAKDQDEEPLFSTNSSGEYCTVLYDFLQEGPGELTVKQGDKGLLLKKNVDGAEGWVNIRVGSESGYVPETYIQMIESPPNDPSASSASNAPNAAIALDPLYEDPIPENFAKADYSRDAATDLLSESTNESFQSAEEDVDSYSYITVEDTYCYDKLTRTDVELYMMDQENGSFLLRLSNQDTHLYTISLKFDGKIKNFRVRSPSEGRYQIIGKSKIFDSLIELLTFYGMECLTEKGELLMQQI